MLTHLAEGRKKVYYMRTDKLTWLFQFLFIFLIPSSFLAQDFKTVHDGVEYAQVTRKIGEDPVKINLLRLDLTKVRLDVHHAMDAAIGTEKTSSIAARHGAAAAINAGFFRLDDSIFAGDSAGVLKIDGNLWSEPTSKRVAIFIDNKTDETRVIFDQLETRMWIEARKRMLVISGINRERKADELIEYTPAFHRSTLTAADGVEVIVRRGRVRSVLDGKGNSVIPQDGYILSAAGTSRALVLSRLKIGQRLGHYTSVTAVSAEPHSPSQTAFGFEDITNGVPQLIKNSKIDITWEQEKASRSFVETRHPRTAVAKLKDGKFLMITVDGRQPGVSVGMNLYELADYLLNLGAVDAMNLDGGGSTTMVLDGKVVNKPSDKEGERKVGDAILVTLRNKDPKCK
jgi:exopolysaccharide biosynthesis protein